MPWILKNRGPCLCHKSTKAKTFGGAQTKLVASLGRELFTTEGISAIVPDY